MSDTSFAFVSRRNKLIDIVDKAWLEDCLSDTEIEVPKDFHFTLDFEDDEEDFMGKNKGSTAFVWNDLGIDLFLTEPVPLNHSSSAVNNATTHYQSEQQQTTTSTAATAPAPQTQDPSAPTTTTG